MLFLLSKRIVERCTEATGAGSWLLAIADLIRVADL